MDIFKKLIRKNKKETQVFEISLHKIIESFDQMSNQAGWDTSDKLYWGFYFLDHNNEKLQSFGKLLKKEGYTVVEIRHVQDNLFSLHAEKYAIYTPESLVEQFNKLADFSNENRIEIFDGWDVEKFNMNSGLIE